MEIYEPNFVLILLGRTEFFLSDSSGLLCLK